MRLSLGEVTRVLYDFKRKVGAFIGAVACNEEYWRARLCGHYMILSGKSAISRSKFTWSCEIKSTQNKPLGLVFWQSRVKVHSALTLFNGSRRFATP